ncbi:MAG: amino acid/amide transporter substrate-binding protein family [Actinomycetia bacterium]|nr:amino acid/amide transporter substrate-binding protein family [Actinomycetes bacterium]
MKPALPRFPAKAIAATAVAVLAAGVLAGCTGSGGTTGGTSDNAGPITIGASLSLTGQRSADGLAFQKGYELWASDVNAHGGLLGRQVKLEILNDNSSATQVVTNYGILIGQDKVDLTFGPYSTLLTTPASAVAARYGYAFVEGAGGGPAVFDTPLNQADRDVFDVSQPVAASMEPLVNYIRNLATHQSVSVAFPYTEDPFAAPPVQLAEAELSTVKGVTVDSNTYSPFTEDLKETVAAQVAQQVAAQHPTVVILGSTDVPMVAAFMSTFEKAHYTPQLFVAASGPDQGSAFTLAVGPTNAAGLMVPNSWFPGYPNTESQQMVKEYVAKYGGTASGVNADVAEAYSVGQVMAQAVTATGGIDNAKIISYLHSDVTLLQTVQGPVMFDALGENAKAAGFMFQWNNGSFVQALDTNGTPTAQFLASKPAWATG